MDQAGVWEHVRSQSLLGHRQLHSLGGQTPLDSVAVR